MGDTIKTFAFSETPMQALMGRRLTFEACENIHLHWRNMRVEMSVANAFLLLSASAEAHQRLLNQCAGKVVTLPLDSICPWDTNHRPSDNDCGFDNGSPEETKAHKDGVRWFTTQIFNGKTPWPIAVRPLSIKPSYEWTLPSEYKPHHIFQRLDGFKRYMAHKQANRAHIQAFIVSEDAPGCQDASKGLLPSTLINRDLEPLCHADAFTTLSEVALDAPDLGKASNRVEKLRNGQYHLHIGDVRLEFTAHEVAELKRLVNSIEV